MISQFRQSNPVVKIEAKNEIDKGRQSHTHEDGNTRSAMQECLRHGKKTITIDISDTLGRGR